MVTPLRKKRLLKLATGPADHKKYYPEYCELRREGLIHWCLGTAFLTPQGKELLDAATD